MGIGFTCACTYLWGLETSLAQQLGGFSDERLSALRDALSRDLGEDFVAPPISTEDCNWNEIQARLHPPDPPSEDDMGALALQWVAGNQGALKSFCCLAPEEPRCWNEFDSPYARCCFPKLAEALKKTPEWVLAEVAQQQQELRNQGWGPASLSKAQLDAFGDHYAYEPSMHGHEDGKSFCRFQIVDGVIRACDVASTKTGHDDALLNAIEILSKFTQLPDVDFFVSTVDVEHHPREVPIFTKQRPAGMDGAGLLLIPHEFLLTPWNRKMHLIARRATKLWPWARKVPKLFWRGGSTAQWMCGTPEGRNCTSAKFADGLNLETMAVCPRGRLVLLSSLYPSVVDAKFSNVFDARLKDTASRWGWLDYNRPSHEAFFYYRYGWNDEHSDAVFWRLRGNSLQFITVGRYTHWLLPHGATLRPFKHFLPIQHDQSDLVEQFKWAQAHEEDARRIAETAANMTTEMLDPEAGPLVYLHALLLMYAELQSF